MTTRPGSTSGGSTERQKRELETQILPVYDASPRFEYMGGYQPQKAAESVAILDRRRGGGTTSCY